MNKNPVPSLNNVGIKGWTERRLYSGKNFAKFLQKEGIVLTKLDTIHPNFAHLYLKALEQGMAKEKLDYLIDKSAKKMFAGNFLWEFFKKSFNLDLQIPFLFGVWTTNAVRHNLVTTRGKRVIAEQVNGVSTAPVTAIAIGTDNTAAAAGNTALGSESTTNGAQRGAATTSNQTTTTTGDTARWVKTFSLTGTFAFTEEGLFDNNTSGGNMLARNVYSTVNVVSGDSLQITHNVQFT